MPRIQTKSFGEMSYSPDAVFEFPQGVPGHKFDRMFACLEQPTSRAIMFMQSLSNPGLSFTLFPVVATGAQGKLRLSPEDMSALRLPASSRLRIGKEIECVAPVRAGHDERQDPTGNLLAPILLNLRRRIGIADAVRILMPAFADLAGPSRKTHGALVTRRRAGEGFLIGEAIEVEVLTAWTESARMRMTPTRPAIARRKTAEVRRERQVAAESKVTSGISSLLSKVAFQPAAAAAVNSLTMPVY